MYWTKKLKDDKIIMDAPDFRDFVTKYDLPTFGCVEHNYTIYNNYIIIQNSERGN